MGRRKIIPLTMTLLCSLCLATACNKESSTTNIIATVDGSNITAEDIYSNTLYNTNTAEYVYGVLEKALIKSVVPVTNSMITRVDSDVSKWQNEIKENATLNSTDYKEDLQKALEEQGVSSVEEYKEKKIYELQYEYAKNKFLEATEDTYRKAFIDANYLYHVGDIQLGISSSSTNTDLYNLTISPTEAKAIYDTITELVKGEKYYNVAFNYSKGDAAKKGGDLGIVTLNDTEITNELRYALIGYSSLVEGKYDELFESIEKNTVDAQALKAQYSAGMQSIPYSYIKKLNDVESTTTTGETKYYDSTTPFYYSSGGNSVSTSRVYYRNIVFNNLLNTKMPRFITVTQEDVDSGVKAVEMDVLTPNVDGKGYSTTTSKQYVLTNELGNPYVVFKDSNGLHILTINKTAFASDIYDYYSKDLTKDNYVSYAEFGNDMEARLAEVENFASRYITRDYGGNSANEKLLSFEVFKYYMSKANNGNFKIVNDDVNKMINQYINAANDLADLKVKTDFVGNYDTYSNLIWFRNTDTISKEIPLLSCLDKNSNSRYMCTYRYGSGFAYYDQDNGGGN